MDTIETLRQKLQRAEQHRPAEAKYPTDLMIDKLTRQLALSDEEINEFKQERDAQTTYQGHLDLMRKWFGIVFIQ